MLANVFHFPWLTRDLGLDSYPCRPRQPQMLHPHRRDPPENKLPDAGSEIGLCFTNASAWSWCQMAKLVPAQCLTPVWCWHKCSAVCHGRVLLCQVEASPERWIFIDSQSSLGWKVHSNDDEPFYGSKILFPCFAALKTKGFLDPNHSHVAITQSFLCNFSLWQASPLAK